MQTRILVAYATRAGSTAGVAEAIGETLRGTGAAVDVRPAKEVRDLSGYSALVLGSGVRAGRLYGEATRLLGRKQDLAGKPLAFFCVCLSASDPDKPEELEPIRQLLDKQLAGLQPVDQAIFGGALEMSKLNFLLRAIMKRMSATDGDFRDWDAIRAWAAQLAPKLAGPGLAA